MVQKSYARAFGRRFDRGRTMMIHRAGFYLLLSLLLVSCVAVFFWVGTDIEDICLYAGLWLIGAVLTRIAFVHNPLITKISTGADAAWIFLNYLYLVLRHCNGKGYNWENLYVITDVKSSIEYLRLDPGTCLIYGCGFILTVAVFEALGHLLVWSLRPLPLKRNARRVILAVAAVSFISAVVLCGPLRELGQRIGETMAFGSFMKLDPDFYAASGIKVFPHNADAITAAPGRNLVLIVLESTEETFLREDLFPGLLPNLKKFSGESLHFTDIRMAHNATISFTGVFCMLAGVDPSPFILTWRGIRAPDTSSVGRELGSLPKILRRAGYRQYACFGHDGDFHGTRMLLLDQEYDQVFDSGALNAACRGNRNARIRDSAVYEKGWELFCEAAKSGRPFNLTLLTLDAHGPDGYYSPDEPGYPRQNGARNQLFDAMYASDFALGAFLRRIREHPAYANTVIVTVSDHLAHRYTNVTPILDKNPQRRMLFCIHNPVRAAAGTDVAGASFDVAPTVLSAMGVRHNYIFPLGEDLFRSDPDGRRLQYSAEQERKIDFYIALKSRNTASLPFEFELDDRPYPQLRINELAITLARHDSNTIALPRDSEVLALKIDRRGKVYSRQLKFFADVTEFRDHLDREKTGKMLICARNSPRVADFLKIDAKGEYVIGIIDGGVFRPAAIGGLPLRGRI